MTDEVVEVHAVFRGEVQGVGFRAMVHRQAMRLGLLGTVCNLPDGSVELYVLGARSSIRELLAYLTGPLGPGNVSDVISEDICPPRPYTDFQVLLKHEPTRE